MPPGIISDLISSMPRLTFTAVLDILIVAVLIYQCIMLIRGRRAARVLIGIGLIVCIYAVAVAANLEVLRAILGTLAPYSAFGLIVMFQSEIRRALSSLGERRWLAFGSRLENIEVADEILFAVSNLAQNKVGALIVIEREVGLRTFIESGVPVDSRVTRDLLLSIFQPGGALHDGAVIVQGGRLAAAACFLPLTMNPELSRKLGTRHRAGIGVTEESDCLSIIVSEERGAISLARMGELEMDVAIDTVAQRLGRRSKRRSMRAGPVTSEVVRK
jgi:diadenylate cyclase